MLLASGVLGLVCGIARASEDDLAVIRKAVAQASPAPEPTLPAVAPTRKAEPQWLRIRIEPKGEGKGGRVRVNVPLAFVRAVGDSLPAEVGPGCRRERRAAYCGLKLGEVLKSLESGQDIVQVDDEEQTVRVWLE
jgi:hypothetical protein